MVDAITQTKGVIRMKRTDLMIIDPQGDFCNQLQGSLKVAGANTAMARVSRLLNRIGNRIVFIHTTLDSHRTRHIAHAIRWKDKNGNHPNLFTLIPLDDVKNRVWMAAEPHLQRKQEEYIEKLTSLKRNDLMIWPPHCLIGSPGHAVWNGDDQILNVPSNKKEREDLFKQVLNINVDPQDRLWDTLGRWEVKSGRPVNYVTKGSNEDTEHYSAMMADVPDPGDTTTQLNIKLINIIEQADLLLWTGIAGSHCLRWTMKDTFANFGAESLKKSILLEDCTANVAGCESMYDDFVKEYSAKGMQVCKSTDL
jgi:nicotinamidase/pyrazinamidase